VSNEEAFNAIYTNSTWGHKSGPGSDPANAAPWIAEANKLLAQDDIHTVLDLGCGDWRLCKELNLEGKEYTGIDVSSVIIEDIKQYESEHIKFMQGDLETIDFPQVDLILIKDVLQHLPIAAIHTIMNKIMASAKYALICNDIADANTEIKAGEWRGINLALEPFNYKLQLVMAYGNKRISLYRGK